MNKVKVSKEVANAIEYYKSKSDDWCDQIFIDVLKSKQGFTSEAEAIVLDRNFTMIELADVLLNGYIVELTPLEKLELVYSDTLRNRNIFYDKGDVNNAGYYSGYVKAMEDMSETLELKVHFNRKSRF